MPRLVLFLVLILTLCVHVTVPILASPTSTEPHTTDTTDVDGAQVTAVTDSDPDMHQLASATYTVVTEHEMNVIDGEESQIATPEDYQDWLHQSPESTAADTAATADVHPTPATSTPDHDLQVSQVFGRRFPRPPTTGFGFPGPLRGGGILSGLFGLRRGSIASASLFPFASAAARLRLPFPFGRPSPFPFPFPGRPLPISGPILYPPGPIGRLPPFPRPTPLPLPRPFPPGPYFGF